MASGIWTAPTAFAFDCRKASTPSERAICADPELKKLDAQLNRDYAAFRAHYQKSGKYDCLVEDETKEQKEWLRKRDACGADKQCIRSTYEYRLQNLNKYTGLCYPQDSSFVHAGRSCYEPTPPTASVASTTSPTAPTASTVVSSPTQQCSDNITRVPLEVVKAVYRNADPVQITQWSNDINTALNNPKISDQLNTKYKLAFFLGQAAAETGNGHDLTESLNYQSDVAYKQYSYFKKHGNEAFIYGHVTKKFIDYLNTHPDEAKKYGLDTKKKILTEKDVHEADEEAIGNRAYANRPGSGNGDVASGDGYKYRGRGLIQLTYKNNYKKAQKNLKDYFGEDIDLVKDPYLVAGNLAMKAALSYWTDHKIGGVVENAMGSGKGIAEANSTATKLVNGPGLDRLSERLAQTKRILAMDFFKLCKNIENGSKRIVMSIIRLLQLA